MEPVHIHRSRIDNNFNVLFLLIPSIVFVIILAIYVLATQQDKSAQLATTTQTPVLGEETELDKADTTLQNK